MLVVYRREYHQFTLYDPFIYENKSKTENPHILIKKGGFWKKNDEKKTLIYIYFAIVRSKMPENNQIATCQEPVKNQSRGLFSIFKKQKKQYKFTQNDTKESVHIRQLKKQVKILEGLLETKDGLIDQLQKDLKEFYSQKDENKIWTLVENFLVPKKTSPMGMYTESGRMVNVQSVNLTDDQIKAQLAEFGAEKVRKILELGDDNAKNAIGAHLPQLSEDTLNRGLQIAKGMI